MVKRLLFLITAGLIMSLCGVSSAYHVGGTEAVAAKSKWAVAPEIEYVADRDMKGSSITEGKFKYQNLGSGRLTFQPAKFVQFFGKAGLTNFNFNSTLDNGLELIEKSKPGAYFGGGAKVKYEVFPRFTLALDAQFSWFQCDIEDVQYDTYYATDMSGHMTGTEYQGAFIASYKIPWETIIPPCEGEYPYLSPYAGVKYAKFKLDSNVDASNPDYYSIAVPAERENKQEIGFVLGTDISFASLNGFNLNIEVGLLDETSVSGNLTYSF